MACLLGIINSLIFFFLVCLRDGIHFTVEASKVVVKEILKVIKEADWEPSLHYNSLPAEFGEDSPYDPVSADGETTINASEYSTTKIIQWLMHEDG